MGPTLPSKTIKMELSDKDYSKMSILSKYGDDGKEHSDFVNTEVVGLTSSGEGGSCTYNIVIKLATYH
jgi:ferritin